MIATCGGWQPSTRDDFNYLSSCLVLDTSTGQWEENIIGPLLQGGRAGHAAVTLKNRAVYLLGGQDRRQEIVGLSSPSSRTTDLLPANSTTWQKGPPLPIEMEYGPCAVAISATSFLVFYKKEIREFDASIAGPTSSQGWARGRWPKMETSRHGWPGCAKVGEDKVIIAGGWHGMEWHGEGILQTTEILDLSSRTIRNGGKMATPRSRFHIITFNNNGDFTTLALGGRDDDNDLKTVEEWNPVTESWSTVETQLKEKRTIFGAVAAPKRLICPSQ